MERRKPTPKESPERIVKQRNSLIANYMTQLATALGQTVTAERIALYCRGLADVGETQLRFAFGKALKNLGDFLPSIQQLHVYAGEWRPPEIQDNRHILERGSKPPDWEPLKPGELEQMKENSRRLREEIEAAAREKTLK